MSVVGVSADTIRRDLDDLAGRGLAHLHSRVYPSQADPPTSLRPANKRSAHMEAKGTLGGQRQG